MKKLLVKYKRDLALKGYSQRTCEHYFRDVKQFLEYYNLPISEIDTEKIKNYLFYLISERKASDSKIRISHSAIRYFFMQTLSRPWEAGAIPYVKKKKTLPKVFSFKEVISILKSAANIKHKALLALIYSSGLRLSESVNLKITDIKRDNKRILVRQGKGAKDRYTILSDICLKCLWKYWKQYKPNNWLFPGYKKNNHLSPRACQHAFSLAKERAGITKEGSVHTLRHSFATHFLEAGGGLFQLQKFLGHKCLKTTLLYAHIQTEKIVAHSPLDFFLKEQDDDDSE